MKEWGDRRAGKKVVMVFLFGSPGKGKEIKKVINGQIFLFDGLQ